MLLLYTQVGSEWWHFPRSLGIHVIPRSLWHFYTQMIHPENCLLAFTDVHFPNAVERLKATWFIIKFILSLLFRKWNLSYFLQQASTILQTQLERKCCWWSFCIFRKQDYQTDLTRINLQFVFTQMRGIINTIERWLDTQLRFDVCDLCAVNTWIIQNIYSWQNSLYILLIRGRQPIRSDTARSI